MFQFGLFSCFRNEWCSHFRWAGQTKVLSRSYIAWNWKQPFPHPSLLCLFSTANSFQDEKTWNQALNYNNLSYSKVCCIAEHQMDEISEFSWLKMELSGICYICSNIYSKNGFKRTEQLFKINLSRHRILWEYLEF